MSPEFELGLNLITRFEKELRAISESPSPEDAKPIIESIKHPIFGAAAQIKAGDGPLKEDILKPLLFLVSNFRELSDFEGTKEAVRELLGLVEKARCSNT
ncbi:MAG TPA: hypothetical protein EYP11_06785 [Aquificaceae bacterium]|nr:hypothetical protein [Aquificaceae bacterium]HIQ30938.1 hypothetical protein [Aquifex aeolicus]